MYFRNKSDFLYYVDLKGKLGYFSYLGSGSQGIVYFNKKTNQVFKFFYQFFEKYDEEFYIKYCREDILKFSNIINDTFKWPTDVIMVGSEVVGYISEYVRGRSLSEIDSMNVDLNSLSIHLDRVIPDIKTISNNGVLTFDVMYNILYGNNGLFVIDHDEYTYSDIDSSKLYQKNAKNFNDGIVCFLVDNYFDEFVSSYKDLTELYKGKSIDTCEFLKLFRKYLSEYVGRDVSTLSEASSCLNKKKVKYTNYQRTILN